MNAAEKKKKILRTENCSSVKVWLELYWELYILMVDAVNFLNKDLHWLCGKRTFIVVAYICMVMG